MYFLYVFIGILRTKSEPIRPIIIKNLKTLKILEAKIQEILKIENMLATLEVQKP